MQIRLTDEMVLNEIESFEDRIKIAKLALASLPATAANYKDRKKIQVRRRVLQDEINHVYRLISIAKEAMDDLTDP